MESGKKGVVQISDDVISVIAATAAKEIKGVAGLNTQTNIMNKLSKKNIGKAKDAEIEVTDGNVSVSLGIIAAYDCKVREVAKSVQDNVKNAIETMTGLNVSEVNVIVTDICRETTAEEG